MTVLIWTEAMSVGVPELDEDHRWLISIINRLGESTVLEESHEPVRLCLLDLLRYAEKHFGREESVMLVCGFPGLEVHKEEHQDFIDEMQRVMRRFEKDPKAMAGYVREGLLAFLRDWLNHHILIEDKAYQPFTERKPTEVRQAAQAYRGAHLWRSA